MRPLLLLVVFGAFLPFILLALPGEGRTAPPAYRLVTSTQIVSTPHAWLKERRVAFRLPEGWRARALPRTDNDKANLFPQGWWVRNWNKAGIQWRLRPERDRTKPIFIDFDISMASGSHSDTFRTNDARDVKGRHGFQGFDYDRSFQEGFESRCIVLRIPDSKVGYGADAFQGRRLYLLCEAKYPVRHRARVAPIIDSLIRSCSVRR